MGWWAMAKMHFTKNTNRNFSQDKNWHIRMAISKGKIRQHIESKGKNYYSPKMTFISFFSMPMQRYGDWTTAPAGS
jgi:hypothetical protein